MYARTSLGVQKRVKLENRVCFWSYIQIFERTRQANFKKRMQKRVFRVYFHTWKYMISWVHFVSPWTSLIPLLPYEWPPGQNISSQLSAANKLAKKSILLFAMCVRNLLILSSLSLVYWATRCCILSAVSSTPLGTWSKSVIAHWKSLCLTCSCLLARLLSFSAWIEI